MNYDPSCVAAFKNLSENDVLKKASTLKAKYESRKVVGLPDGFRIFTHFDFNIQKGEGRLCILGKSVIEDDYIRWHEIVQKSPKERTAADCQFMVPFLDHVAFFKGLSSSLKLDLVRSSLSEVTLCLPSP